MIQPEVDPVRDDRMRIIQAAGIIGAAFVVSRLLGVVRDAVINFYYNIDSLEANAYFIANGFPEFIFYIVAGGAIGSAFIPTFSAYFVRDPEALTRTLAINPAYLASREGGRVIDYRDWSVPLGRRFRALKLWFVIRSYGVEELRRKLASHIAWTQELAGQVAAAPDFDLMSPASLALFNFRHHPPGLDDEAELDRLNARLLEALNDSGHLYLTQNRVKGRTTIRFSVGQTSTTRDHVQRAWETIKETAAGL